MINKRQKRIVRHRRIRAKVSGTAERPRLSIYKSNRAIYGQLIDDEKGVTIAAGKEPKELAAAAKEKGVIKVTFDRGGFIYTGRVKKFAEEARAAGLEF